MGLLFKQMVFSSYFSRFPFSLKVIIKFIVIVNVKHKEDFDTIWDVIIKSG